MNALYEAAREAQRFFRKKRWRFCFIGALAVIRWGEPRATHDVDVSLMTGFGKEKKVVAALLELFEERMPGAADFALESRVFLARASNGVDLDISLAAFPFEAQMIDRASAYSFVPGFRLVTTSAEDLIAMKAFAGRGQDWTDVRGVITRQGSRLNWAHIVRELNLLCAIKEDWDPLQRLEEIRQQERDYLTNEE